MHCFVNTGYFLVILAFEKWKLRVEDELFEDRSPQQKYPSTWEIFDIHNQRWQTDIFVTIFVNLTEFCIDVVAKRNRNNGFSMKMKNVKNINWEFK